MYQKNGFNKYIMYIINIYILLKPLCQTDTKPTEAFGLG